MILGRLGLYVPGALFFYMTIRYCVTTSDERRQSIWLALFGTDTLPVLHRRARWQDVNGRNVYAYDLDLGRLSQAQRNGFAGYIARRTRRNYVRDVKPEIDNKPAYPIPAANCQAIIDKDSETAVNVDLRPFLCVVGKGLRGRLFPRDRHKTLFVLFV